MFDKGEVFCFLVGCFIYFYKNFLDASGRTPTYTVMLTSEIIKKDNTYDTEEGVTVSDC